MTKRYRRNINFRQSVKEFRSQNYSKIVQHFKINLAQKIFEYSIKGIHFPINIVRGVYKKFIPALPKNAKKIS